MYGLANLRNSSKKTGVEKLYDESPTKGDRRMKLLSIEIKLLLAIHVGQAVVKGDDVHTLSKLIAKGYAEGRDASSGDGAEYIAVHLTPQGRGIANDLYTDE